MKMLNKATNLSELKSVYKRLVVMHHPDNGGCLEKMKELNNEYDLMFPIYKARDKVGRNTKETATSTRKEFYTSNGWQGKNFNSDLCPKDIAKIIRTYVKEIYPNYKFSITCRNYNKLDIALVEAPTSIFNKGQWCDELQYITARTFERGWSNRCYFGVFNELGIYLFTDICRLVESYKFDDSDAMQDYYHTNFYCDISLGKHDKPFRIVERTPRVKGESKTSKSNNVMTVRK
jgi:hypothetical protein